MRAIDFAELYSQTNQENPSTFGLPSDAPASQEDLDNVETSLNIKLPASYRLFLQTYGGGDFGFLNVFSADANSYNYLPERMGEVRRLLPANFVAISDDQTGGFYGFKVDSDGRASDEILHWEMFGSEPTKQFENIFAFAARYALKPA